MLQKPFQYGDTRLFVCETIFIRQLTTKSTQGTYTHTSFCIKFVRIWVPEKEIIETPHL